MQAARELPIAPIEFRVKPVPSPIASLRGKSTGNIPKTLPQPRQGFMHPFPISNLTLFTRSPPLPSFTPTAAVTLRTKPSNAHLPRNRRILSTGLARGKNLFIKDIKCLAPDGRTLDLSPIILKID